jgi:hypothetical protein
MPRDRGMDESLLVTGTSTSLSQRMDKKPQNLFVDCRKHGLTDPQEIIQDKLNVEFLICKRKLDYLVIHGPRMCKEFLHKLILTAKRRGDQACATKIAMIIQRKKVREDWRRINCSTRKPRGALTIAVKVPQEDSTSDNQHTKYKTKDGIFYAASKTLVECFQSALVAQCHQGTFFEDMAIWPMDQLPSKFF